MTPAVRDILFSGPPGWVLRGTVPADLDFDFANGRHWQRGVGFGVDPSQFLTCSRASTGYAQTREGLWLPFSSNVARITNQGLLVEEARTNSIRNNSMQGAVVGSPGTPPTNWSLFASATGLTESVVGTGAENGIDYIDVRLSGTTSGTINRVALATFENFTQIAALNGQSWAASVFVTIVGGSAANVSEWDISLSERSGTGSFLAQSLQMFTPANSPLGLAKQSVVRTLNQSTVAFVDGLILFSAPSGAVIDFTLRIGWPQLELGAFATSPIRTTNAAVTRAADVVTVTNPPVFGSAYTLFLSATAPPSSAVAAFGLQISDNSLNNRFIVERQGASFFVNSSSGGVAVNISSGASPSWGNSTAGKLAASNINGSQQVAANGTLLSSTAGNLPVSVSKVNVGSSISGTALWNNYISEIAIFANSAQPAAQLQAFGSR